MKKINFTAFVFLILFNCDDQLSEVPDFRTNIDSAEKISELLVAAYPEGAYVPFLEPLSDNADDKSPAAESDVRINEEMYFWRDLNDTDTDTPTYYWNRAYEAISHANQALISIEQLGGGSELNAQKGEALLCRAYAHFMLVNIFAKQYNPNTSNNDLGIPYVTEPETVLIKEYQRASVAEVYELIEKDLVEGLPLVEDDYDEPRFHFTKQAANAFASRFYLHTGDWQKVIDYSNEVLAGTGILNLRDVTGYRDLTIAENVLQYSSADDPSNLLLVSAPSVYSRSFFNGLARYQLSQNLQELLFEESPNDNGDGYQWSYRLLTYSGDLGTFVGKYDEYFRTTNQAAGIGIPFVTYMLLTTDEVLMNRAEAYAMLGNFESAVDDINLMFSTKTNKTLNDGSTVFQNDGLVSSGMIEDPNGRFAFTDTERYTPFYDIPVNRLPYINLILNMRRTIFFNEGLRWLDVRRHDIEVIHRQVNAFGSLINSVTLGKGDNRRAVQIPSAAQAFNIEANPR